MHSRLANPQCFPPSETAPASPEQEIHLPRQHIIVVSGKFHTLDSGLSRLFELAVHELRERLGPSPVVQQCRDRSEQRSRRLDGARGAAERVGLEEEEAQERADGLQGWVGGRGRL